MLSSRDWEDPEAWREKGRCWGRTTSPETDYWFPDSETDTEEVYALKQVTAKTICYVCQVKEECLRYAIEAGEVYGIWGGKTMRERSIIKRQWGRNAHP